MVDVASAVDKIRKCLESENDLDASLVYLKATQDISEDKLLFRAVDEGLVSVVALMADSGCNINVRSPIHMGTVLHTALYAKNVNLCMELIRCGIDLNQSDVHWKYPLHLAIENDLGNIDNILLACGANPNVQDKDGLTPLHVAASKMDTGLVPILIGCGADPTAVDKQNRTPKDMICLDHIDVHNEFLKGMYCQDVLRSATRLHEKGIKRSLSSVDEGLMDHYRSLVGM